MVHRKEEYRANGHEITIQQVTPDSSISAWIDGWAAYEAKAIKKLPLDVEDLPTWEAVKKLMDFMADQGVYYCQKCDTFYDHENVSSTGFAGHQCGQCANNQAYCPDSSDNEHEDTCLNPRQKNNARMATKYKCKHCGRRRSTTPTG